MNEKIRIAKELHYKKDNDRQDSVCCGFFHIKNKNVDEICKNCDSCYKFRNFLNSENVLDKPQVNFHYVDSFRKCKYHEIEVIDGSYIVKTSIYNIIFVNDLACDTIIKMQELVREQDKETQKIYRALQKRRHAYEVMVNDILDTDQDFLAEYNTCMSDVVDQKRDELENNLEDFFTRAGCENPKFLSLCEMARTMVGYSVHSLEKRIQECAKYEKNCVNLRVYKMTEILRVVENLSDWVMRKVKGYDLNKDKGVMNAYRELDKTLRDRKLINNSIINANKNLKR